MASAVSNLAAVKASGGGNERFNHEAQSWDQRPFVHEASAEAAKAILRTCNTLKYQPKQILEIGCGTGILSFLMAPHSERVVAIDAAEGMIEVLKTKMKKEKSPKNILPIAVLLEDPEDAGLPPSDPAKPEGNRLKFDLITSHLVLHHIPELEPVLRTMLGCLCSGGKVMLTDFEDFGPEARRFHAASKMSGVERNGINATAMAQLMQDIGFINVKVQAEWEMRKLVEKYDGEFTKDEEFGKSGPGAGGGEMMDFPFLVCYGEKP
ncbi:hypothetical protein KC356_g5746 [Hortaea werneckii]|nr:hypothetical protein KC356_g5746 [Hortaea werneckii]